MRCDPTFWWFLPPNVESRCARRWPTEYVVSSLKYGSGQSDIAMAHQAFLRKVILYLSLPSQVRRGGTLGHANRPSDFSGRRSEVEVVDRERGRAGGRFCARCPLSGRSWHQVVFGRDVVLRVYVYRGSRCLAWGGGGGGEGALRAREAEGDYTTKSKIAAEG